MRKTIKDLEGSISVQGKITPISRQPIEEIQAEKWHEMSLVQLHEQRRIMTNRVGYASMSGNLSIVNQLEAGIRQLDVIIAEASQRYEDKEDMLI